MVPVRGCQSCVSSIRRFLLRSFGMKHGMFSTRRPCLRGGVETRYQLLDGTHTAHQHNKLDNMLTSGVTAEQLLLIHLSGSRTEKRLLQIAHTFP